MHRDILLYIQGATICNKKHKSSKEVSCKSKIINTELTKDVKRYII